jgi:hypothetical protein
VPSISRLLSSATNIRVGRASLDLIVEDLDDMDIERLAGVRLPSLSTGETGRRHSP